MTTHMHVVCTRPSLSSPSEGLGTRLIQIGPFFVINDDNNNRQTDKPITLLLVHVPCGNKNIMVPQCTKSVSMVSCTIIIPSLFYCGFSDIFWNTINCMQCTIARFGKGRGHSCSIVNTCAEVSQWHVWERKKVGISQFPIQSYSHPLVYWNQCDGTEFVTAKRSQSSTHQKNTQ